MKPVYEIWCEWDIGHEGRLFSTKEKAMKWLQEDENLKEVMEDRYESVDELIKDGLVSITEKNIEIE